MSTSYDLDTLRARAEQALAEMLNQLPTYPPTLAEAIRYAVEGGGKRLRPTMCLAAAQAASGNNKVAEALPAAVAIELLHSYTLIHDDLPAMDNDRERRGKPSVWVKFGEETAILAGDALQALAFQQLTRLPNKHILPDVLEVFTARAVGVVRGQMAEAEGTLDFIYQHKTCDLFECAAEAGAFAVGADSDIAKSVGDFACHFGRAFQYADDLDDATTGETGGFSATRIMTPDAIREAIADEAYRARASLDALPGDTSSMEALLDYFK